MNLQGKVSILATPIILDVVRILALAKDKRLSGVLHDLTFFIRTPIFEKPPYTDEDQMGALRGFLAPLR